MLLVEIVVIGFTGYYFYKVMTIKHNNINEIEDDQID